MQRAGSISEWPQCGFQLLLRGRQKDVKGGALTRPPLGPDASAMTLGDTLAKGQTDPGAGIIATRMQPGEHLENTRRVLGREGR